MIQRIITSDPVENNLWSIGESVVIQKKNTCVLEWKKHKLNKNKKNSYQINTSKWHLVNIITKQGGEIWLEQVIAFIFVYLLCWVKNVDRLFNIHKIFIDQRTFKTYVKKNKNNTDVWKNLQKQMWVEISLIKHLDFCIFLPNLKQMTTDQ